MPLPMAHWTLPFKVSIWIDTLGFLLCVPFCAYAMSVIEDRAQLPPSFLLRWFWCICESRFGGFSSTMFSCASSFSLENRNLEALLWKLFQSLLS
jgi:hypothetical protein